MYIYLYIYIYIYICPYCSFVFYITRWGQGSKPGALKPDIIYDWSKPMTVDEFIQAKKQFRSFIQHEYLDKAKAQLQ